MGKSISSKPIQKPSQSPKQLSSQSPGKLLGHLAAQADPGSKTPSESAVIMTEIVLPSDTNALGTIFGGKIMSWIDIAGAIAAGRHARRVVVTASIDALHFLAPVKLGHVVLIRAMVNFSSRTSMEVGVRVDSENPITGEITHTSTAYTTFVALDANGRPTPIPQLIPETPQEKRRFNEAKKRRESRIRLAEELKKNQ